MDASAETNGTFFTRSAKDQASCHDPSDPPEALDMAPFPIGLMILLGVFCLAIGVLLLIAAVTSGPKKLETLPRRAVRPKPANFAPSGRR